MKTEKQDEQEKKEEREGQDETTKGKETPVDIAKKLQRGRLIFKREGTKGFIDAGYIV